MVLLSLCLLGQFAPITPSELKAALDAKPRGNDAQSLALRVRSAFPEGTNLKLGTHAPIIGGEHVAFVLEARTETAPRVAGPIDHGRGREMVRVGESRLWAWVEEVPPDVRFPYRFEVGPRSVGGGLVAMPGWSPRQEARKRPEHRYGDYVDLSFHSDVYGNDRTGWAYLPAGYQTSRAPAALIVFLDGEAYRRAEVGTIVENLIADGEMPLAVLVGLDPGTLDDGRSARSLEYDADDAKFARFLETEVLAEIPDVPLHEHPNSRAIVGASSAGFAAFNVARLRPDLFRRAAAQLGRFTGEDRPSLVREAEHKPIRVVLTRSSNGKIDTTGDWSAEVGEMHESLKTKGHESILIEDQGFAWFETCARQLPDVLRSLWADVVKDAKARRAEPPPREGVLIQSP